MLETVQHERLIALFLDWIVDREADTIDQAGVTTGAVYLQDP
jgi:hypothetical protein